MYFTLELGIILTLVVCGCWSRRVAVVFLPIVAVSLTLFAIYVGNPIGLLVSGGGWMILDVILAVSALIAQIIHRIPRASIR
jgi:hypothetical protein